MQSKRIMALSIVVMIIFIVLISPLALNGGFGLDDFDYIDGAMRVNHEMSSGQGTFLDVLKSDFVRIEKKLYTHYRPGSYLITSMIVWSRGADAPAFIVFGLLSHLIITLLFYRLAYKIIGDWLKAFWAALFVLSQPLVISAVIWPGAAIFYMPFAICHLLVILSFVKYLESHKQLWLLLSASLLLLQCTFLEGAAVTILVLFAYYLFAYPGVKRRGLWIFFLRPIFYPYYAAMAIWLWLYSLQNLQVSQASLMASFAFNLRWQNLLGLPGRLVVFLFRETEKITGFSATSSGNHIISYVGLTALFVFGVVTLVQCLTLKKSPKMQFVGIWFFLEVLFRLLFGVLQSRVFYNATFPFAILLIVFLFWLAERISGLLHRRLSTIIIGCILALLVFLSQAVSQRMQIRNWNRTPLFVKHETDQILAQAGDIKRGDSLILMAPTAEQNEMIDRDSLRKRLRAYLNDYTATINFLPFDSAEARRLSQLPWYHVLVGTPGQYQPYRSDLDVSRLIPASLQVDYRRYQENAQRAREYRERMLRPQPKP